MATVDKVVKSCAERKAPFQISKKAVNEIEQIAKDAKYTSPYAATGEKVAGEDLADAYRAYNIIEDEARKAIAKANEQLAKTPKTQEFADSSQYLG